MRNDRIKRWRNSRGSQEGSATNAHGVRIGQDDNHSYGAEAPIGLQQDQKTVKFTGHQRDPHGLSDYMMGRTCLWPLRRFASVDPARDGWNLYAYTANNPIKFVGPDGRSASVATMEAASLLLAESGLASSSAVTIGGSAIAPVALAVGAGVVVGAAAVVVIPGAQETLTNDGFSTSLAEIVFNAPKEGEVAPDEAGALPERAGPTAHIHPSEVSGRTPAEIDSRARELGLEGRGPAPAQGRGSYVDPQTGKQRILSHPNGDPPHGHVNNPSGQRIGADGSVVSVSPRSPAAHLPIRTQ